MCTFWPLLPTFTCYLSTTNFCIYELIFFFYYLYIILYKDYFFIACSVYE